MYRIECKETQKESFYTLYGLTLYLWWRGGGGGGWGGGGFGAYIYIHAYAYIHILYLNTIRFKAQSLKYFPLNYF